MNDSWRLETLDGTLLHVFVQDDFNPRVGSADFELDRAPGSPVVVVLEGDGTLTPEPLEITFIIEGRDEYSAQAHASALSRALRTPRALWGAGPLEGLRLPLAGAYKSPGGLTGPKHRRLLTYQLVPASVMENALEEGWRYPVLDDVSSSDLVFEAEQGVPGAPIFKVTAEGSYHVPLTFNGLEQGTFVVGSLFQTQQTLELLSIDRFDIRLRYEGGVYLLEGQGQTLPIPKDDVGGFGYLNLWVPTLAGQTLRLHSFSPLGFKSHGSLTLPDPLPNVAPTLIYGSGATDALIMPGASMYRLPAFSHRVRYAETLRDPMSHWYSRLAAIPSFTIKPPPYALNLQLDPAETTIVADKSKTITATLVLSGGIPSTTEYEIEVRNDEPGIEVTVGPLTDAQDDEAVAKVATITVAVTDSVAEGEHVLTVQAKAVGWVNDFEHPYYRVFDEQVLTINASLYGPELTPGALMVLPIDASPSYSEANLKAASVGGLNLEWAGEVWPTAWGDGVRSRGTAGSRINTAAITGRTLAKGVEVASPIAGFAEMRDGAPIVALMSTTRKNDYTYVHKVSGGVRIRTSRHNDADGTGTISDSPTFTLTDLTQPVFLTTPTSVILWDMATNRAYTWGNPGWPDSGSVRASWFCLYHSDGTAASPTPGILLTATVHALDASSQPMTDVRRDRNMRYVYNQYARRGSAFARSEYPLDIFAIWEMNAGEVLLDRTLRGATLQKLGTGITEPTGGGLNSDGASTSAIWSGWLSQKWDSSFVVEAVFRELTVGYNGGRQLGISNEDNVAQYVSIRMFAGSAGKVNVQLNVGTDVLQVTDIAPQALHAVRFEFAKGAGTTDGSITFRERFSGRVWGTMTIPAAWAGRISIAGGAVYRGKQSGVVQGIWATQTAPVKLVGIALQRGGITDTEEQGTIDNLSGLYPATLPPPLEDDDDGTTTPPPPPPDDSTAIYSRAAIIQQLGITVANDPNLQTEYTTTASQTWAALFTSNKDKNKYRYPASLGGNISQTIKRVPLTWNGTATQIENNMAAGEPYFECGNYHMTRLEGGIQMDWWGMGIGVAKSSDMIVNIQHFMSFILDSLDKRGSPESFKKASEINSSHIDYLNIIYGNSAANAGVFPDRVGRIISLENGLITGHTMAGAFHLWRLRTQSPALTPTLYLDLTYQALAWMKLHVFKQWEQYHKRVGTWFKSGSTTEKVAPGFVKDAFLHAVLSEAQACMFIAIIESEMFAAGMTAPKQVTLKGYNYTTTYGSMSPDNWTGDYTLDPSTTADKTTHAYWKEAAKMFKAAYDTAMMFIEASRIKDNTNRSRYASGVIHFQQGVPGIVPATKAKFPQPTVYITETITSLLQLWQHNLLADPLALGSAGAADTFMKRVAAGMATGTYRFYQHETPSKRVTYNAVGIEHVTVNGVVTRIHPYDNPPWDPKDQNKTAVLHHIGTGVHFAMAAFDTSGHLTSILNALWASLDTGDKSKKIGAPVAGMMIDKINHALATNTG